MDLSFRTRISVVPDVLASPDGHETVLLNPETELSMIMDQNAAAMWQALASTSSFQEAFDRLRQEFDVEPERLRNDLVDFVGKLWLNTMIALGSEPDTFATQEQNKTVTVMV